MTNDIEHLGVPKRVTRPFLALIHLLEKTVPSVTCGNSMHEKTVPSALIIWLLTTTPQCRSFGLMSDHPRFPPFCPRKGALVDFARGRYISPSKLERALGISQSTVSMCLNDPHNRCSPDVVQTIWDYLQDPEHLASVRMSDGQVRHVDRVRARRTDDVGEARVFMQQFLPEKP